MEENPKKDQSEMELGFGSRNYNKSVRFINVDGRVNVKRAGLSGLANHDTYHWLISVPVWKLAIVIVLGYAAVNMIFAFIYFMIGPENFGGLGSGTPFQQLLDLFYFSSQTITTLGYGHVHPLGNGANLAASVESLLGLLAFAIATGILFGRFSRPRAHILYSRNLLMSPYRNGTALMFRITNKKQYELIECEASITLTMNNLKTGKREFFNLPLEISRINFLALSWTIVHPVDEGSPLHGLGIEDLNSRDAEVLILIRAINDTFMQTVYSRYSYKAADIVEKAKFTPLPQEVSRRGRLKIDVTHIHHFGKIS